MLCDDYTPNSLYDNMTEIIKNSSLIDIYGARAREVVQENFNSSNFSKKYLELYHKTTNI